ncbi:MAG: hypothetical protein ABS916_09990 [Carnobacterium sp.]|uniref:hypothetical protein n=1 Tax=Carnobacterium sp. TaxID=48221 RepID=UPI003314562E
MKNYFYAIVSTTRKSFENKRVQDKKGRWSVEKTEVKTNVDVIVTSPFRDKFEAVADIKDKAASLGAIKYIGAFK